MLHPTRHIFVVMQLNRLHLTGKPLPEAPADTAMHASSLPKNMEARAEFEMRKFASRGLLDGLEGEGEPLPYRHNIESSSAHSAIQQHVQKSSA